MRASAALAQQTLTPEAGAVLKHSLGEAQRRGHAHVTPLHVASTLLAIGGEGVGSTDATGGGGGGSTSLLRRACLQSHVQSQHPLQCRALELCFAIALDRLPASHPSSPPALSNALVAALKRAQAHQRRGSPEQQQLPLLAVKVELEHLILSILDDPSVSRVMREAGFSSPLVKLSLEEATSACFLSPAPLDFSQRTRTLSRSHVFSPSDQSSPFNFPDHRPSLRNASPPNFLQNNSRSSTINPVDAVIAILLKEKQSNPVLLGDSSPSTQSVVKEFLHRLKKEEIDQRLQKVKLVFTQFSGNHKKEEMEQKLLDLRGVLDQSLSTGVIAFLGDLQWLLQESSVESMLRYSSSRHAAMELGRLLMLHGGSGSGCGRLWVMATATTLTYFRCRTRYPSLEQQWGLQPLPISSDSDISPSPRLDFPQSMAQSPSPSMEPKPMWLLSKSPTSKQKDENSAELSCCPDSVANFDTECAPLQEHEMASNPESVQSCSSPTRISGRAPQRLLNPGVFRPWLQRKPDIDLIKDEGSTQVLQRNCQTQHVEFHGLGNANASLTQEPTSSSSHKAGTTNIDGKTAPNSQSSLSLDSNGVMLGSKNRCNRSAEALDKAWMSLQPRPVQEHRVSKEGEASENDVLESDHRPVADNLYNYKHHFVMDKIAAEQGSIKTSVETHKQQDFQERHEKQDSELTVQTDLALGRPKTAIEGLHRDIDDCSKGRITSLISLLEGRCSNKNVRSLNVSTEVNRVPVLRELFQSFPLSNLSNAELSKDFYKLKQKNFSGQLLKKDNSDALKSLRSTLEEKFPWQKMAVHAIASTVVQCRSGMGRRRGLSFKGDIWLLFVGPDRIVKRKIARFLAKSVYGCEQKIIQFHLNLHDADYPPVIGHLQPNSNENGVSFRGKSMLDRIAEAIRAQPSAVLLLEDVDKADNVIRRELNRAMKRGKLSDLSGREVSLANSIVIMTSNLGSGLCTLQQSSQKICFSEERLQAAIGQGMKLIPENLSSGRCILTHRQLSIMEYTCSKKEEAVASGELINPVCKRKASSDEPVCDTGTKRRKDLMKGQRLALDLNLPVTQLDHIRDPDEEFASPSPPPAKFLEENLSDTMLRIVHESLTKDFCNLCDEVVLFQSANYEEISNRILDLLSETISSVTALQASIEIDVTVLEHLVAAAWEENCNMIFLKKWAEEVLGQTLSSLILKNKVSEGMILKLVSAKKSFHPDDRFSDSEETCLTYLPKHISTNSDS